MKKQVTQKEANSMFSRLFGEEDSVSLTDFTDEEFKHLIELLENVADKVEWEANKAQKEILIWKPKTGSGLSNKDYTWLMFLLAVLKGQEGRKWLRHDFRRANKNNI